MKSPVLLFFGFSFILAACLQLPPVAASENATTSITADSLVAAILADNPELRFYESELAAARAAAQAAAAPSSDPELAFELGRKRVRESAGAIAQEGTAWSVSVSHTFDWPGRAALRKAIANRNITLAELGLQQFRAGLAARARTLAFGLHAAAEQAAATAEVAERFRALKETLLARDPAGLTPLLETRVIEAQELALQRRAMDADLAWRAALRELNQLRGAAIDAPLTIAPVSAPVFRSAPELDQLLASARARNFEFRARQVELEQQGFVVELARHERRPSLTVSPFVERESAAERETTAGIGVSVPLPLTSRSSSNIAAAEARRTQAETALLVAGRELERSVADAAATFAARRAEMERWKPEAAAAFRDAAALADRHYRLGAVPLGTYIELQTACLEAVETLLETRREALEAALELELLTGLETPLVKAGP